MLKKVPFKPLLSLATLLLASNLYASDDSKIVNNSFKTLLNDNAAINLTESDFETAKNILWSKYLSDAKNLTELKSEFENRSLQFGEKTMKFSLEKRGTAPASGYPLYIALHGGGNASSGLNDSQWWAMKTYYNASVTDGIYVATRGISDHWNLHFEDESYPLYDKLIESAILYENVDPNRVYILGFSAGGDGIYQIPTRMPDRFAAANMSAGHSNGITLDNLHNTPFLIQVGERDTAYDRNRVAVKNSIRLDDLNKKYGSGYTHDVFVHYNGSHNSWKDNDAARNMHPIIANPIDWLNNDDRSTKDVNSNAIDWLNQYNREALPKKLVWDLKIGANYRTYQTGAQILTKGGGSANALANPKSLFYWLDVSQNKTFPENGKLVIEAEKATNTINILEATDIDKFKVLLNPKLLDLSKPIKVKFENNVIATINVKQSVGVMIRTLLERSDVNQVYSSEVTLSYDENAKTWKVVSS